MGTAKDAKADDERTAKDAKDAKTDDERTAKDTKDAKTDDERTAKDTKTANATCLPHDHLIRDSTSG